MSPVETICVKCQILFSEKNNKNITGLSSAELAQRVVKIKRQSNQTFLQNVDDEMSNQDHLHKMSTLIFPE